MHPLLQRQLKKFFGADCPEELELFVGAVEASYVAFEDDAKILHRAMELSSQELTQANSEVRAVIEAIPDVILRIERDGTIVPMKAPESGGGPGTHQFNKRRISSNLSNLPNPAVRDAFRKALDELFVDGQQKTFEYSIPSEFGENYFEVRLVGLKETDAIAIIQDITKRKQAESEHERLNQELISASRYAGMAEVATGVLHNVGNVLNSVNVSVGLLSDQLSKSKTPSLTRAVEMLREHQSSLGEFLTNDPKGKQLPDFIGVVADQLARQQAVLVREVQGLQRNIEHIKEIVAVQQSYAKVSGAREKLFVHDLVEHALRMASASLAHREIEFVREFAMVPGVLADRHLVLQILVNLITNAKQALDARTEGRRLVLRTRLGADGNVCVDVSDNGIGISRENLAKIFSHGFTTKKTGHGFGLHSSANAAKEMGGSLLVRSDGPGTGATFVLELPAATATTPARPPLTPPSQPSSQLNPVAA
jgi:signal transduction histidine kinase